MPIIRLWVVDLDFLKGLPDDVDRGRLEKDGIDSGLVFFELSRREDRSERVFNPSEEELDIWGWIFL